MGSQSGKVTAAGEHQSLFGSTAGVYDPFAEESTDVLRRRAENLLDEMMFGAADLGGDYGADRNGASYVNGANGHADSETPTQNGAYSYAQASDQQHAGATYTPPEDSDFLGAGYAAPPAPPVDSAMTRSDDAPVAASAGGDAPRLVSAADRYAAVGGRAAGASPQGTPANGAVRRQSPSPASTMTIGARASLRSNLLPRSSEVDAAAAQQEIDELTRAVAIALPPGHEATERSRHLLNKAQNILQSDQSRSAEIEYYLQQVRRILERTQQRTAWSDLYRTRLWAYLVSWTLLALVVLMGVGSYRTQFAAMLAALFDVAPDAPWVVATGMTVATACAGALGAVLGVYIGIARRQRTEFGYFDRKYGLRGLLMPVIGFVFGGLIAGAFAVLFNLLGIDPNQSVVALLPIGIAFFVGIGQESLYGAR